MNEWVCKDEELKYQLISILHHNAPSFVDILDHRLAVFEVGDWLHRRHRHLGLETDQGNAAGFADSESLFDIQTQY